MEGERCQQQEIREQGQDRGDGYIIIWLLYNQLCNYIAAIPLDKLLSGWW